MSWLSKAVGAVSKGVSQLDPTSSKSFVGKVTAPVVKPVAKLGGSVLQQTDPTSSRSIAGRTLNTVGSAGLNLLPKNTKLGTIGRALEKSSHDAASFAAVVPNAAGAAVGVKGADKRLSANVSSAKRQAPVIASAVKGLGQGGWAGFVKGAVQGVQKAYVDPALAAKGRKTSPVGQNPAPGYDGSETGGNVPQSSVQPPPEPPDRSSPASASMLSSPGVLIAGGIGAVLLFILAGKD